ARQWDDGQSLGRQHSLEEGEERLQGDRPGTASVFDVLTQYAERSTPVFRAELDEPDRARYVRPGCARVQKAPDFELHVGAGLELAQKFEQPDGAEQDGRV